jgi:ornithine cyclodeaminase/alanine dehydrogenase-like protein (mu-crystallin family)
MLVLSNEEAEALLHMPECMDALEQTYRQAAEGTAVNGRRSDMITSTTRPDSVYCLKLVGGVVPALKIGALRLNSDILSFPEKNGSRRKVKVPAAAGDRWVGLVMLFSTETGEPLAIFPDGVVQRARVGATSGLAVRHLARPDAKRLAILGSGWQAGAQAMAAAAARPLSEIRCYSPNLDNARQFAGDLEKSLGIAASPAASAKEAVEGADIVLCATNSLAPVLDADWLQEGVHLGSIRDRELPAAAILKASKVFIHHPDNMGSDHLVVASDVTYDEGVKAITSDPTLEPFTRAPTLADLVSGRAQGRTSADEITCFLNYHGLGYQFAAVGAVFYRKALEAGCGHALPTEWFTENVHP